MLIRSMIINHISASKLVLTDLESADETDGKVRIIARMNGYGKRRDDIAEDLIRKISGEQHVVSVGWEIL